MSWSMRQNGSARRCGVRREAQLRPFSATNTDRQHGVFGYAAPPPGEAGCAAPGAAGCASHRGTGAENLLYRASSRIAFLFWGSSNPRNRSAVPPRKLATALGPVNAAVAMLVASVRNWSALGLSASMYQSVPNISRDSIVGPCAAASVRYLV